MRERRTTLLLVACAILFYSESVFAQQGSWVRLAPVGEARQEVAVAEVNGKIYLVGGIGAGISLRSVEVYDPKIDRWSFVAPMPETLHHTSAVGLDGRLYVIGGYNSLSFNPVNSAYRYDPDTNQWTQIASLPSRRGALASVVVGNRIYAVGGEGGGDTGELAVYNPATNSWSLLAPMLTERDHITAGVINGKIYVAGGRNNSGFTLDTLEEYDPATNTWRTRAPMPTGRSGIAGTVLNNRFYVFGGEGNRTNPPTFVFSENESYDPITNGWRAEVRMPTPRHGIAATTFDGRIYIPGGGPVQGFSRTDINEAFLASSAPMPNRPPVIESVPRQVVRGGGQQQCVDLRVTDPDGDSVTIICAPENPSFVKCGQGTDTRICLAPGLSDEGEFSACAIARDSAGNETKSCFAVTVIINHPPRLDKPSDITLSEGDAAEIRITASDEDTGRDPAMDGRLTLALLEGPGFVRFTDNGSGRATLNTMPGAGAGGSNQQIYNVTIEARDSGTPALRAVTGFQITVKAPSQPVTPLITSATFRDKRLTIGGLRFAPSPRIEINGAIIDATRILTQSEIQIVLKGNKKKLNLRRGTNVLVVIVGGERSSPFNLIVGN
jgi:N-acetylneuraminic acid mutarotase